MASATAYLFEELKTAVGRDDAAAWLRVVVKRAKLNTAARDGRCAATDPENLPSPPRALAPSARRPAHAAQTPTESVLTSEDAKKRVLGWRRKWHSCDPAPERQSQDCSLSQDCQATKAKGPGEASAKPTIGAWQRKWNSCGALHWLAMDEGGSDNGDCEALAALTGPLNIEVSACRAVTRR